MVIRKQEIIANDFPLSVTQEKRKLGHGCWILKVFGDVLNPIKLRTLDDLN
jgi:hypothetical protein